MLSTGKDEVMPAEYHYQWSDLLLNDKENEAIEGFRESGKTQYILRAFLLYCLTFPSRERDYIVVIKKNTTLAEDKLKEVEHEYLTNPIVSAIKKEIKEQSGRVFSVDVEAAENEIINVRIEAYGKGASIRGLANIDRRPRICIIDDPQDIEDAYSETVAETDWTWFLSDVCFLGQNTRIFLIGNNLGEKSIIERIFNIGGKLEKITFNTLRIGVKNEKGESNWPSKFLLENIEKERRDYEKLGKLEVWLRERMCLATSEETRVFRDEDYRYYCRKVLTKDLSRFRLWATLDPASSKSKESCYRALTINAVDEHNDWFILDVLFGRWDSITLINMLFEQVALWDLRNIGIERGEYKDVIEPFLLEEMKRRNRFFNIIPIEHAKAGTKLERIKMLQPRFRAHQIHFPDDNPDWVIELKTELGGITKTAIKSLYVDLADSLAMQEQIAERPVFRIQYKNLPRETVEV